MQQKKKHSDNKKNGQTWLAKTVATGSRLTLTVARELSSLCPKDPLSLSSSPTPPCHSFTQQSSNRGMNWTGWKKMDFYQYQHFCCDVQHAWINKPSYATRFTISTVKLCRMMPIVSDSTGVHKGCVGYSFWSGESMMKMWRCVRGHQRQHLLKCHFRWKVFSAVPTGSESTLIWLGWLQLVIRYI